MDLPKRVVEAVERDGLSCNQAAARFDVAFSTAIGWVNRYRETGSVAPGQIGGYRPKKLVGECRDWLLKRCRERELPGVAWSGSWQNGALAWTIGWPGRSSMNRS